MRAGRQVSSLIGDIYDAALDPSLWPGVLEQINGFIVGCGAHLVTRDAVHETGNTHYAYNADPRYVQLYFEKYIRLDPLHLTYLCFDVGEVISNSMFIPHDELIKTRFYKEFLKPQGLIDNVGAVLDKSSTGIAAAVVHRHERDGLADEGARRRMRLLAPHLRRAVLIGNVIELKTAEAASFADALDGLSAALFLVDADGRIVHANAAGAALLAAGHVLRATGGRLAARDGETTGLLHRLFAAADGGDAAVGSKGIGVPLASRDGEPHVAHVLPLTAGARRRAGAAYAAVAALFVRRAALDAPSPVEVLAKTFALTPGELRVLLAVVEVGGVPETAEALGLAETTVKWHLRHLFEKTGAERQADLVKLVAGFSNPLLG